MTHPEDSNLNDTTQEIIMAANSTVIRRNTLVEISLVLSVIGAIIGGTIWATRMSLGQIALREDVKELKALVGASKEGHWLGGDRAAYMDLAVREIEVWSARVETVLKLEPGAFPRLRLPDPKHVSGGMK